MLEIAAYFLIVGMYVGRLNGYNPMQGFYLGATVFALYFDYTTGDTYHA